MQRAQKHCRMKQMSIQVVVRLVAEEGEMLTDRGKRRRTAIGNAKHPIQLVRESSFVQSTEVGGRRSRGMQGLERRLEICTAPVNELCKSH